MEEENNTLEVDESQLSALDENITKKGKNSYYYAHTLKANGPAWDGKEEPRLLAVTPIERDRRVKREFDSYSWMDGKKIVKVFIDHANTASINDDQIILNWTENSVEFIVRKEDVDHCLLITPLNQAISSVTHKRKDDQFVLVLNKSLESSWYQLKKTN